MLSPIQLWQTRAVPAPLRFGPWAFGETTTEEPDWESHAARHENELFASTKCLQERIAAKSAKVSLRW
jgi:hypothetical protein